MSHPVTQRRRLGVRKKCVKQTARKQPKSLDQKENSPSDGPSRIKPSPNQPQSDNQVPQLELSEPPDNNSNDGPPAEDMCMSSSSFGTDLNEEVLDLMDRMDCGVLSSSTPLSGSSHRTSQRQLLHISIPMEPVATRLDFFTPVRQCRPSQRHSNALYSREGVTGTMPPLTSPANTSRKSVSMLQTPHNRANRSLSHWGLPDKVLQIYMSKGVSQMFLWQAECLSMEGVLAGRNVIYSAPTSAGKTLIAELLLLKSILERHKKVIMILPFVSIVHEKVGYLQSLFEPVGIKVGGFMGGHAPSGGLAAVDLAICTIEKANSLINHVMEEGTIDQLGMVIVDELHMVGDHHRGYLLELLLTKLQYWNQRYRTTRETIGGVQLLGMSATLPNLPTLASWLDAVLYQTDYRPVPLQEMVKIGDTLYDSNFEVIRKITGNKMTTEEDEIAEICCEKISNGHSVLIFCPTKAWCEKLATTLAHHPGFRNDFTEPDKLRLDKAEGDRARLNRVGLNRAGLDSVLEQLSRTQVGIDPVLSKTLRSGIAFHHAGLTFDEREIIEGGFRQYSIRVLVATSTLSSGVNLPARLVIVRMPVFHQTVIDIMTYKQMIGRAGRKGVDDKGESILVCKPAERSKVTSLLKSASRPVKSCLGRPPQPPLMKAFAAPNGTDLAALKRAVLEVVVNGTALMERDIQEYLECTLLYTELMEVEHSQQDTTGDTARSQTNSLLKRTLEFLTDKDFIRKRDDKEQNDHQPREFYPTQLGMATVASGLAPDNAMIVFEEFRKARRAFVLENELHIIYLVTPVYILDQWPSIDWYKYYYIWERLSDDVKHVASVVGVQESFIAKSIQTRPPERTPQQVERLRVHRRFFTSLALQDLVHEVTVTNVSYKYGASKGLLQNLQSASGTFAGMVTVFCNKLGWASLELLISQFQSRLTFGVQRELVDLVRISLLNGSRARVLFNAGYHNLAALATANPMEIEKILRNAFPYKTKSNTGSGLIDNRLLNVNWCAKLRKGMTESEAAKEIVQEAKALLCSELNIPESALESATRHRQYHTDTKQPVKEDKNVNRRLSRKIINRSQPKNEPLAVTKQPRLESAEQSSGKEYDKPVLLEHNSPVLAKLSEINTLSSPDLSKNTPGNNNSLISVPSPSIEAGSNLSVDLFKDLSLNTLARLDAACDVVSMIQHPPATAAAQDRERAVHQQSPSPQAKPESTSAANQSSLRELSLVHSTTCSESGLTMIDLSADASLLDTFVEECREQPLLAFAVATEMLQANNGIGNGLIKPLHSLRGIPVGNNEQVVGVAFSWGDMDTYYLSLCESCDISTGTKHRLDMSMIIGETPPISLEYRVKCLESLFNPLNSNYHLVAIDVKQQIKYLMLACHIDVTCKSRDPKVADWLLDPDSREKTLNHMILQYLPDQPTVTNGDGVGGAGMGGAGEATLCSIACHSPLPYLKSSAECVLAEMLMDSLNNLLTADNLNQPFETVEMPLAQILAKMEVNGIGFSTANCNSLRDQLQGHLTELEQEAYGHAGRVFALTSPEDVSIVLFNELNLPSFQTAKPSTKRNKRVQHLSTSKDILEKLKPLHPLPGVVLEWRRVSSTMTRTLFPLFKASVTHKDLDLERIHAACQIRTATGRISFSDPNLQNVPNEYPLGLHRVEGGGSLSDSALLPEFDVCDTSQIKAEEKIKSVCMRDVFTAFPGGVLIAADYSQLELRILAHLSSDEKLCQFLNQSGDAFRKIAGEWLSVEPSNVSDVERQRTKQMCYGMVYGIGAKALGEQMGVEEGIALQFMDSFKSKYPQLKSFILSTVDECRGCGHVVTMMGRKRFLSHINSKDLNKRCQAERQAVNSTIQGSAADLVKSAMINIEREFQRAGLVTSLAKLQSIGDFSNAALLVLQLHDELMFEVHSTVVEQVAGILKREMEGVAKLRVPFPVKIKTGLSWGQLEPLEI